MNTNWHHNITVISAVIILFLYTHKESTLSGQGQIVIDSAATGIHMSKLSHTGLTILESEGNGIFVQNADLNGFQISNSGLNGFQIINANFNGLHIGEVFKNGVLIEDAHLDGIKINHAYGKGLSIDSSSNDGILVSAAKEFSLNIQGNKSLDNKTPSDHIAQLYNKSKFPSPDVLALKVGKTNPGTGVNFITFFDGSGAIGAIEGIGVLGGVTLKSGGADFAELLPVLDKQEKFQAGDIVSLKEGHISKNTNNAQQVMVITDRPIVLGNQQEDETYYEKVSFVGQVPVSVHGPVEAGDWIIAGDSHNGIGKSKSASELELSDLIVGLALESNNSTSVKTVNAIVGLDHSQAIKDHILKNMQDEIQELKSQIALLIAMQDQQD